MPDVMHSRCQEEGQHLEKDEFALLTLADGASLWYSGWLMEQQGDCGTGIIQCVACTLNTHTRTHRNTRTNREEQVTTFHARIQCRYVSSVEDVADGGSGRDSTCSFVSLLVTEPGLWIKNEWTACEVGVGKV